jgi:hypothetical protein
MAKFIARISFYVALALLVPGLIIYLFITFYPAYFLGSPMDYYICKFQYDRINTSNYRNMIIGDSRGNASVNPKELGSSWINLSIPGSDLFEGFYTLKHYLRRNKVDTLVMIYGLDYLEGGSPFFNLRTVPFQFVTPKELHDLGLVERQFGLAFHDSAITGKKDLLLHEFSRKLRYDHFPLAYRATFVDGLTALIQSSDYTEEKSREIEGLLKTDLGHLNFGLADSNNAVFLGDRDRRFRADPFNLAYLDSAMALTAKNNIVTYFIIAPMNRSTWLYYKNSILQSTVNVFLNELAAKYPRMQLIREPVFLDNSYFGDALHVNPRGTAIYSTNLRRFLSNGPSK